MRSLGEGKQCSSQQIRYRLPGRSAPGSSNKISIIWQGGKGEAPTSMRAATCEAEKKVVVSTINELREKMALDLDSSPAFERGLVLQVRAKTTVDYLIIGSSNATRLARAVESMGFSTCLVSKPSWRITRAGCEALAKAVKIAIENQEPGTVIMQLLDNSVYYTKAEATCDEDGRYHMSGEIRIATRDMQLDTFKNLHPVFEILGQRKILLVTPLPRYITRGCCEDRGHGTNRADPDYKKKMLANLETMKRNLKDFIFHEGNRSMRLFDPNIDLRGLEEADIWEDDPVHLRRETYLKIAEGIVKQSVALEDKQTAKRKRTDSLEDAQQPGPSNTGRGRGDSRGGRGGGVQQPAPFRGGARGQRGGGSGGGGYWMTRGGGGRGYGGGYQRGRGYY
jgi:hypothetical protein